MLFRDRHSLPPDTDYMNLIPERSFAWDEDTATGRVIVLVPRFTDPIGSRLIQPRLGASRRHLRVPLEVRGSHLWRLIDGQRTVGELVAAFVAAFPEDSSDPHRRLSLYFQAMYEKKFIRYVNLGA